MAATGTVRVLDPALSDAPALGAPSGRPAAGSGSRSRLRRGLATAQDLWTASTPGRVWIRHGRAGGGVLAAGAAYYAFFSLVPALAVGFTVLGLVLGGREDLQADVVRSLNESLGTTLVSIGPGQSALVSLDELTGPQVLGTTGLLGAVGLVLTGLGWAGAIRTGVRSVFGVTGGTNPVVDRLRDALVTATLGVAVLASIGLSLSVTTWAEAARAWLGFEETTAGSRALQVAITLLVVGVDAAVLAVVVRVTAGTATRWRDLAPACVGGAVALGLLKLFGGLLLGRSASSRIFTALAVVIGVLLWLNLAARIVLMTASWAADRCQRGVLPVALRLPGEDAAPAPVPTRGLLPDGRASAGRSGAMAVPPAVLPPGADGVSVAAGAVLGATAAWFASGAWSVFRQGRGVGRRGVRRRGARGRGA